MVKSPLSTPTGYVCRYHDQLISIDTSGVVSDSSFNAPAMDLRITYSVFRETKHKKMSLALPASSPSFQSERSARSSSVFRPENL